MAGATFAIFACCLACLCNCSALKFSMSKKKSFGVSFTATEKKLLNMIQFNQFKMCSFFYFGLILAWNGQFLTYGSFVLVNFVMRGLVWYLGSFSFPWNEKRQGMNEKYGPNSKFLHQAKLSML